MQVAGLARLLEQGEYADCLTAAEQLLRHGGLSSAESAVLYWALSRSLEAMHAGQVAIGPGELTVHFARESRQFDLLGRALVSLSELYAQSHLDNCALANLDEYFRYFALYGEARKLEGQVFHLMARCLQSTGRELKALEYCEKAYRWQVRQSGSAQQINDRRADLIWQYLQLGQAEPVPALLADTEAYLQSAPHDLDARARCWNSRAYLARLNGRLRTAIDYAVRVVELRPVLPIRKAEAFLLLHHAAAALGSTRIALGLGMLARIQATIARRPELEDEASRTVFHLLQAEELPPVDEVLRRVREMSRNGSTGQ